MPGSNCTFLKHVIFIIKGDNAISAEKAVAGLATAATALQPFFQQNGHVPSRQWFFKQIKCVGACWSNASSMQKCWVLLTDSVPPWWPVVTCQPECRTACGTCSEPLMSETCGSASDESSLLTNLVRKRASKPQSTCWACAITTVVIVVTTQVVWISSIGNAMNQQKGGVVKHRFN